MKTLLKQFLKYYLKAFTKVVFLAHRPTVITVAGSMNKSFVKDSIKKELAIKKIFVRANSKSFNTEIGLPLATLSLDSGYNSYKRWLPIIFSAPITLFKPFPKYLVLEFGVSTENDMKYLLSITKPRVSVITDITQRYLDSFSSMGKLIEEYEYLVKSVDKDGLLVLSFDNKNVRNLAKKAKCKVVYYGIGDGSDWQIKNIKKISNGQAFILKNKSGEKEIKIKEYGLHNIYSFTISQIVKEYVTSEPQKK